jgi:hypothetical protein
MDIACKLLDQVEREGEEEAGLDEKIHKLQQLKSVLKMYDQFSGINRKIQLKLVHKGLDGEPLKRCEGWMDGWMDGRMDEWMDGWMDSR